MEQQTCSSSTQTLCGSFGEVIADMRESILLQIGGCGIALFMDDVSERNYPEDEDFWL